MQRVYCLRQTPADIEAFYSDILIGVIGSFRDEKLFEEAADSYTRD